MSQAPDEPGLPLAQRHPPIWRATRRFQYQLDAVRELLNEVLRHVSELDDKHFSVDALVALKNLPEKNRTALDRYIHDLIENAEPEAVEQTGEPSPTAEPDGEDDEWSQIRIQIDMSRVQEIVDGDRHFAGAFFEELEHLGSGTSRVSLIHNSLLVMAIGAFEVLVGGIATRFYVKHQSALDSDEKVFSFKELRDFGDVDDAADEIISRKITDLMYGELDSWASWFEENCEAGFDDLAMDYEAIREAFQRRHVVLHNAGMASRQYLKKVKDARVKVGEPLPVTSDYLNDVLDELDALGTALGILAEGTWNHENRDFVASLLLRRCYELMVEKRWTAAESLAALGEKLKCQSVLKSSLQCNVWLCRAERFGYESVHDDVSRFDTSDMAPRYELVKLVLLGEADRALALVSEQVLTEQITRGELADWPILRKLREHPNFDAVLAELDGETQSG